MKLESFEGACCWPALNIGQKGQRVIVAAISNPQQGEQYGR